VAKTRQNGLNLLGRRRDPLPEATVLGYLAARQTDRVTMPRKARISVTPDFVDVNDNLGLR